MHKLYSDINDCSCFLLPDFEIEVRIYFIVLAGSGWYTKLFILKHIVILVHHLIQYIDI